MTSESNLKKIPYGISNYTLMREENYYYVDKTGYIKNIENKGRYLFFIRPRRFGKSLFLSTLTDYYDINRKARFDSLFAGTCIGQNPTKEKNNYLVLNLDFSMVDSDISRVEDAFLKHIENAANFFVTRYAGLLDIDINAAKKDFSSTKSAAALLDTFLNYCREKEHKIYAVIDEYDNFANTILSTAGEHEFQKITHGEGFLRSFFNALKGGTTGSGAPVSRLFMTGVSPITLDDVTSGFNIAQNISLDTDMNEFLGFTWTDVKTLIEYYRATGKIRHTGEELLEIMKKWYNGYRFTNDSSVDIFNSVQVLYFINQYLKDSKIPFDLIDRNVRIDYNKLRQLIVIDRKGARAAPTANGNFSKLTEIIENGAVHSAIEKGFSIDRLTSPENFVSLLFYFGLLTIAGVDEENVAILKIPNETIRRLYYDYIKETYEETDVFSLDMDKYTASMRDMAFKGEWTPLVEYIAGQMEKALGLRDFITGEKAVQAFLNVYLGLSPLYIIHSERELNKGYADLVLEPFLAQYPGVKYSYLIEIKYLKPSAGDPADKKTKAPAHKIKQLKEEAETQLKQYGAEEKFQKTIARTTLVKVVLVFCGHRLVYRGEVV